MPTTHPKDFMEEVQMKVDSNAETAGIGLKLGINYCDNHTYHADRTALSSTVVKTIYKDLAQYYREYILMEKPEQVYKSSFGIGTLTHSYILEPELLATDYNFVPLWDRRAKEYKQIVASLDPNDRRTLVTMTEKAKVEKMMESYEAHPVMKSYFTGGAAEVTLVGLYNLDNGAITFNESDEGPNTIRIKVRLDYLKLSANFASDVKTTGYSTDIETFRETCNHWMYPLSGALYLMVAEAYYKTKLDFYFGVLSTKEFTADVYKLSRKKRTEGEKQIIIALQKFKAARDTGNWEELKKPVQEVVSSEYKIEEV